LYTVPSLKSTTVRYLHAEPDQGLNRYRARVLLSNGQQILTDIIQNYYLTQTPFIVFPNPVSVSQDINVFSGKFTNVDFRFDLFQMDGALVRSARILSDREFVSTTGLSPGLYVYRIEGAAGRFTGKVLLK
jgi:hypothetical protein